MITPEKVAKFSVYDGIVWSTVTGSTPINGTAFVTAVFNKTNISLYVNGTLDGRLDTGPSSLVSSTLNVTIGAYENTLRSEASLSNFYSGILEDITIYQHAMIDSEVEDLYLQHLQVDWPTDENKLSITLLDGTDSTDAFSIPTDTSIPVILPASLVITDDVVLSLNGIPILTPQDSLVFSDDLSFVLIK